MAKVSGIIQIEGTLSGITFYKRKGVWIARKAGGGFNGKAIKTKASMVRVRENGSEFGRCMKNVQLFKKALFPLLVLVKDTDRHARIVSLFTKIKNSDVVSERGSRSVAVGLQQVLGRELLINYLLTKGKDLSSFFATGYLFEWETGIRFYNLDGSHLFFPKGAHIIEIQLMYARIDFENQQYEISECTREKIGKDFQGDLLLPKPDFVSELNGVLVACVSMRYMQEVNNELHPLLEQQHSVIQILDVL